MKFTKMQGLGNDYVYVNCFEETVNDPEKLAIAVSDRHFGIGSDGLILITPSEVALPHGYVQSGRFPRRDVRQRHPLCGKICV